MWICQGLRGPEPLCLHWFNFIICTAGGDTRKHLTTGLSDVCEKVNAREQFPEALLVVILEQGSGVLILGILKLGRDVRQSMIIGN